MLATVCSSNGESSQDNQTDEFANAALGGDVAAVKRLLKLGADPNLRFYVILDDFPERGMSPLMVASLLGHTKVVSVLLAARAEVNLKDDAGNTALIFAALGNYIGIFNALRAHGAEDQLRNNTGCTAL